MANTTAMCSSFKTELLTGTHNFSTHSFRAALFLESATINASTTSYTGTITTGPVMAGEVSASGTNYVAGGVAVPAFSAPILDGTTAWTQPSASIAFPNVTLNTANFDAILIYNTSASNKAVSVHKFTPQQITAGTLTLTMPTTPTGSNALIRLA